MVGDNDEYGPGYGQWKKFLAQQKARQRIADAKRDMKRLVKKRSGEASPNEPPEGSPPAESGRHQSQRERMQELRARRKEAGLVLVQVWVPRGTANEVQQFARLCRAIEPIPEGQPAPARKRTPKKAIDGPRSLRETDDGSDLS